MNVPDSYFLAQAHMLKTLESMTPSVVLSQDLKLKSLVMEAIARLEFWHLIWSSIRDGSVEYDCVVYRFEVSSDAFFHFRCCMCFCASTTNSAFACGSVLPLLLLSVPVGFVLPLPILKLVMSLCHFWPLLRVSFCPSIIISSIACFCASTAITTNSLCFCAFYVHLCHLHCLVGV